ncbi:amidohydrolase [Desulfobacterota bacterium AH_259_B03_O07]|nr:amidohydrolase [Desulfobacterota bacterium AH_259_B03_O07]
MKVNRKVFDAHTHIGGIPAFKFYDLEEPVKPTVIEYPSSKEYIKHMDEYGIDRAMVISNYGVPDSGQPFTLNPIVIDSVQESDRLVGALWVSGLAKDKERTEEALKHVKENGIVALKATCLLGGTYNPNDWDDEAKGLWEGIVNSAEENDLVLHIHTSPGGGSDISNALELVKRYGKGVKIHLVHMGGFVSGHIKLVPKFINLVKEGYQVYTDTTWAVGFGSRWLLSEIEGTGVGADNVIFASDTPWGDFPSEYWKVEGAKISEELKNKIFWENAQRLYSK